MRDVIEMARDQGLPETEVAGVFIVNRDDLGRFAALVRADALAEQPAKQEPVKWSDYEPDGMHHNKPVVPDAIHRTDLGETLEYIQGWNDCRQAMLAS